MTKHQLKAAYRTADMLLDELRVAHTAEDIETETIAFGEAERMLAALCTAMGFYAPKKIERDEPPTRALIGGDA